MTIAASPDALSLEETMIRQARESFQRLPTLEIIIDRLLLALVPDLKSYCTVAPEIELTSLEYMPYEDAMDGADTLAHLERMLDNPSSGVDAPAAFIVEAVQGEGGLNAASPEWVRKIAAIAKKHGALLIIDEPTRGIDVGTKSEVHRLLSDLAGQGMAILMISSELPELLGMCDRLYVMNEGELVGELSASEASQERIMSMIVTE